MQVRFWQGKKVLSAKHFGAKKHYKDRAILCFYRNLVCYKKDKIDFKIPEIFLYKDLAVAIFMSKHIKLGSG